MQLSGDETRAFLDRWPKSSKWRPSRKISILTSWRWPKTAGQRSGSGKTNQPDSGCGRFLEWLKCRPRVATACSWDETWGLTLW